MMDAVHAARAGGAVTLGWFKRDGLVVDAKGDGSPVTEADLAAEHIIRDIIVGANPGSTIVGEEHGTIQGDNGLVWHVDPIDGTQRFARGVPLYATLVAVDDEHGPAAACINIPATGDIVWAGRGLGCHTETGPVSVSKTDTLEGAFITTSSVRRWDEQLYLGLRRAGVQICGWGDGYGFLLVATGRVDGMIDQGAGSAWDFAPMRVIMSEAGGRFSDFQNTDRIDTSNGVATNEIIHEALLEYVV